MEMEKPQILEHVRAETQRTTTASAKSVAGRNQGLSAELGGGGALKHTSICCGIPQNRCVASGILPVAQSFCLHCLIASSHVPH